MFVFEKEEKINEFQNDIYFRINSVETNFDYKKYELSAYGGTIDTMNTVNCILNKFKVSINPKTSEITNMYLLDNENVHYIPKDFRENQKFVEKLCHKYLSMFQDCLLINQ